MKYSDDKIDELTQRKEATVAAMEKANVAISEFNALMEAEGIDISVSPFEGALIQGFEEARLDDLDAYTTVHEEAKSRDREIATGADLPSDAEVETKYEACANAIGNVSAHCRNAKEEIEDATPVRR